MLHALALRCAQLVAPLVREAAVSAVAQTPHVWPEDDTGMPEQPLITSRLTAAENVTRCMRSWSMKGDLLCQRTYGVKFNRHGCHGPARETSSERTREVQATLCSQIYAKAQPACDAAVLLVLVPGSTSNPGAVCTGRKFVNSSRFR